MFGSFLTEKIDFGNQIGAIIDLTFQIDPIIFGLT